eukprot:273112_1
MADFTMEVQQIEILLIGDISTHNSSKNATDADNLPTAFKKLVASNTIDYILCTGNIVSKQSQQFLFKNCKRYIQTKGDKDECLIANGNYTKSNVVSICNQKTNVIENYYNSNNSTQIMVTDQQIMGINDYKIGLFHGSKLSIRDNVFGRVSPCIDKNELLEIQREFDVDILIYGSTNRMSIDFDKNHKKVFINCGSIVGNDTIITISPLVISNWIRMCNVHQIFPIPIVNLIGKYGKQTYHNDKTFASLTIQHGKTGQKCTMYSYKISNGFIKKNKVGQFEDVYNYRSF